MVPVPTLQAASEMARRFAREERRSSTTNNCHLSPVTTIQLQPTSTDEIAAVSLRQVAIKVQSIHPDETDATL